jgi:hypothetical protein
LALLLELALLDHGGRRLPRPPSRLHSSEPEASATPQHFPNPPPSRERVDPQNEPETTHGGYPHGACPAEHLDLCDC